MMSSAICQYANKWKFVGELHLHWRISSPDSDSAWVVDFLRLGERKEAAEQCPAA